MPKDVYHINEDIDYGYAESKVRTSKRSAETEDETAHRVRDARMLEIWTAGKVEAEEKA